MSRRFLIVFAAILAGMLPGSAHADEILFTNGDRLTGKIKSMDGGKLILTTDVAGDVTVDMAKVRTFTTDAPVELQLQDGTVLKQKVTAGDAGAVRLAEGGAVRPQSVALSGVKRINPPPVKWTGTITASALVTEGNSETQTFSLSLDAARRAEKDRITVGAGYLYAREEDPSTGDKNTTTDNWFALGKYDYFFTPKFYGYASGRVERDRIAELDIRLTPSVGVGYQWIERPDFNFNTEAGAAWVYEKYRNVDQSEDHVAARLAYHLEKKFNDKVTLFHNMEYLPSAEDFPDDYNVNADAGIRAALTARMFTEFKLEWRYDETPAPGAEHSDLRYIMGLGWQF